MLYGTFHQADLSGGSRVIGGIIGFGFSGMGLLFLFDLPGLLGRHTIIVDFDAIAYRVAISYVKSFRVPWAELKDVAVSMAERDDRTNSSTLVRLDLTPLEPDAFAARHPELARLRRDSSWRLFLGPNPGRHRTAERGSADVFRRSLPRGRRRRPCRRLDVPMSVDPAARSRCCAAVARSAWCSACG